MAREGRSGRHAADRIPRSLDAYGDARDHADSIFPTFARNALVSNALPAEGMDHIFEFTHIDEVLQIASLIRALASFDVSGSRARPSRTQAPECVVHVAGPTRLLHGLRAKIGKQGRHEVTS